MSKPQAVSVQIYNQVYQLACDASDPQHVRRAAAYLDQRMHEAAEGAGQRLPLDIAVLAAMAIAEQLLEERRRRADLLEQADQRLRYFTSRLEDQDGLSGRPAPRF
jgi:cell division protein ZapA (FtsZ GTPase activity inhibitor)